MFPCKIMLYYDNDSEVKPNNSLCNTCKKDPSRHLNAIFKNYFRSLTYINPQCPPCRVARNDLLCKHLCLIDDL